MQVKICDYDCCKIIFFIKYMNYDYGNHYCKFVIDYNQLQLRDYNYSKSGCNFVDFDSIGFLLLLNVLSPKQVS